MHITYTCPPPLPLTSLIPVKVGGCRNYLVLVLLLPISGVAGVAAVAAAVVVAEAAAVLSSSMLICGSYDLVVECGGGVVCVVVERVWGCVAI